MCSETILEFAVLRFRDGWQVVGPAGRGRSFSYRVDAEEAALRLAAQARKTASEVRVLVQDDGCQLHHLKAA